VQGGEQEVARAVAGEHAARPIAAVRGRGQADDHDACTPVAEAREGPAPVLLPGERGPALAGDLFAPRHKTLAAPAHHDLVAQSV